MTRRLAREEGTLVGISAGANVACALKLAEQLDEGCVVTILCDKGNTDILASRFGLNGTQIILI